MLHITFHNDSSGNEEVGNYFVRVSVNHELIFKGRVEGHKRSLGWVALLAQFVIQMLTMNPEGKTKETDDVEEVS